MPKPRRSGRSFEHADPVMDQMDRIAERVTVEPFPGCWIIDGDPDNYHSVCGKPAHRWFYRKFKGPIPKGCHIHHVCGRPGCVNPDHLEPLAPGDHSKHHHWLREPLP